MIRFKWKLLFVDKPVFFFYAEEQKKPYFNRKGCLLLHKKCLFSKISLVTKVYSQVFRSFGNSITKCKKELDLSLNGQGKNMQLYNKVQNLQRQVLIKNFVVKKPKMFSYVQRKLKKVKTKFKAIKKTRVRIVKKYASKEKLVIFEKNLNKKSSKNKNNFQILKKKICFFNKKRKSKLFLVKFLFCSCIKKVKQKAKRYLKKIPENFSFNFVDFRLGFNLKKKDVYRKKSKIDVIPRVFENVDLFRAVSNSLNTKKQKIKLENYFFSKTSLEKRKTRFKGDKLLKFPFFLTQLTFAQPKLLSLVKNTLNNPLYGSVRKGTTKGLFNVLGLKEKMHFFVISRWYRIFRFLIFKKYWEKKEVMRLILLACIKETLDFVDKILNFKDFVVNSQFYFRKRWFLFQLYALK